MCLASNIARRAGSASYYARLGIPRDLQPILGRRELWKSLNTKDAREARARVTSVLAGWHAEFDALRRRLAALEPTEADLGSATWDHYQGELERHHGERRALPTSAEIEAAKDKALQKTRSLPTPAELEAETKAALDRGKEPPVLRATKGDAIGHLNVAADAMVMAGQAELTRDYRARRKTHLERHVAIGETALVADAAREIIARQNYAIEEGTLPWRDLCHRLMRAEIEGLRRADEQDRGDYTGRSRDPIVRAPRRAASATVAAPGEGVMELYDVFSRENPKNVRPSTLRMNREILRWFAQQVGATYPASSIDKGAVRRWKQALLKFPIKAAEVRSFNGLNFKQIISVNERLNRPTLSDRTINKYLSALGAYCKWLVQNGYLENNPVADMALGDEKDVPKVFPYSIEDLVKIFNSPLFTGCLSNDEPHSPGNFSIRDHRYWLPLLALFTGARMGELAQLLTADVRQDRGRWIIHITREGDHAKTTKTKGSQRVVPIHPELGRLGFLAFHAERVKARDSRLFPEIKPDARGSLAGHYSRFFGRYVKRIGVKRDASLNFHSLRHGFMDSLRRARYRDEEFQCLIGHGKATTTSRYGILDEVDLIDRCEMIEAVEFPGLDLRHLTPV